MRELIDKRFDMYNPNDLSTPAVKIIAGMGRSIGKVMRQAHDAGVCRFAGNTGNFSYMPSENQVVMHDFDSSVQISELEPGAKGLSLIRDLESAMIGLTHSIAHSNVFYSGVGEQKMRKENPVGELLLSYFKGDEAAQPAARFAAETVNNAVINMIKRRGEHPSIEHQHQWLNSLHAELTLIFMKLVFPVYAESELVKYYHLPYGVERLDQNYHRFQVGANDIYQRRLQEIRAELPDWARRVIGW